MSRGAPVMFTFITPLPGSWSSICLPKMYNPCIMRQSFAAWYAHNNWTFLGHLAGITCTPITSDSSILLTVSSCMHSINSGISILCPMSAIGNSTSNPGGMVVQCLHNLQGEPKLVPNLAHRWRTLALLDSHPWLATVQALILLLQGNPSPKIQCPLPKANQNGMIYCLYCAIWHLPLRPNWSLMFHLPPIPKSYQVTGYKTMKSG